MSYFEITITYSEWKNQPTINEIPLQLTTTILIGITKKVSLGLDVGEMLRRVGSDRPINILIVSGQARVYWIKFA